jgi:hypothetical protein
LDGQPTIEIDIRASFLTIYHARSGVAFDPISGDPYAFQGIPRCVIKQWLVMALGAGKFPARWSPEAGKTYRKETERKSLGKDFPIRRVAEAVLNRYSVLSGLEAGHIDYFDLMFIESEAVIQAMLELLRQHDLPSLPVFDSLIVPKDSEAIASAILSKAYESRVGICPALKIE